MAWSGELSNQMIGRVMALAVMWLIVGGIAWAVSRVSPNVGLFVFWGFGALVTIGGIRGMIREYKYQRGKISN